MRRYNHSFLFLCLYDDMMLVERIESAIWMGNCPESTTLEDNDSVDVVFAVAVVKTNYVPVLVGLLLMVLMMMAMVELVPLAFAVGVDLNRTFWLFCDALVTFFVCLVIS